MMTTLYQFLDQRCDAQNDLKELIVAVADAGITIAKLASQNGVDGASLGSVTGSQNDDGDDQKQLDILADELVAKAATDAKAAFYFSEEQDDAIALHPDGRLALAADPLDGSSNIDVNIAIGTIFSIFKADDISDGLPPSGRFQLAAGMIVYGPQTVLLCTFGDEVLAFALDEDRQFTQMSWQVAIAQTSHEFAINAANAPLWPETITAYIDDMLGRTAKPAANMRWVGSLVAEAYRILRRGGIFLYPQDSRPGYEQGRLRLVYEANPIAMLIEAAGGSASDGTNAILDAPVTTLHQRIPLIFGSRDEVTKLLTFTSPTA